MVDTRYALRGMVEGFDIHNGPDHLIPRSSASWSPDVLIPAAERFVWGFFARVQAGLSAVL
jgi:hypothetical protein